MNIGEPWPDLDKAERRVQQMQSKLHQWAKADPGRRFDDLYNLVYDPAFLVVAWSRVRMQRSTARADPGQSGRSGTLSVNQVAGAPGSGRQT